MNITNKSTHLIKHDFNNFGYALLAGLFALLCLAPAGHNFHDVILHTNALRLNIEIGVDKLSRIMGIFIIVISSLIYHYAAYYLKSDKRRQIFSIQFTLVVLSALLLATAQNLVTAFVAWQFISITLYLFLNYYHHDPNANRSAKKKFVINRIGDCTFLTAIVIALHTQNTTSFSMLEHSPENTLIATLLFISVLTKSAQFPFHIWLLDTMEAPTPVSALMHAGIINSGGILLARMGALVTDSLGLMLFMMTMSIITIALAGRWKKNQPDIKKQLAYSTSSQMGYMILQCSVGAFPAAILHLITHGFFKASLFLNAGETLNTPTKNKIPLALRAHMIALLLSILVSALCFYFSNTIHLKLPLIIYAFIFITIFTSIKTILALIEHKTGQIITLFALTIFISTYLLLLKTISHTLSNFDFIPNIMPIYYQVLGLFLLGGMYWFLNYTNAKLRSDITERLLRTYLLNPIRRVGEKISTLLDQKIWVNFALIFLIIATTLGIAINAKLIQLPANITNSGIILLLLLNIIVLLAANRAHNLRRLTIYIFFYQLIFMSYALMHQSEALNKIILYNCINIFPVIYLLLNISNNQTKHPKYFLTISLLLLIGIPGSASFIAEISLLNAMYELGHLYLILYLSGILLLSLTIMHALQIYSYGINGKRIHNKPQKKHFLYFISVILVNVFFGVFPHTLLALL